MILVGACDVENSGFSADADVSLRCAPNCSGGPFNNTSYAGEWSIANVHSAPGVHATNWVGDEAHTVALKSARVQHDGAWRDASVRFTDDGELRLSYARCSDSGQSCHPVELGGAAVVGARLDYEFFVAGELVDTYFIRIAGYDARTIHGKPAHVYTPYTNAPKGVVDDGREYALCDANSAEDSMEAVFIPNMQLDPNQLTISAREQGAIIACQTGADGKLVLGYGYHPTDLGTARRWTAGLKTITADICGDGRSYTTPGRVIDVQDSLGVHAWSGKLLVREGDYDDTGMICRGEAFRGHDGVSLAEMEEIAPCLKDLPPCDEAPTAADDGALVFSIKVEGDA